MERVIRLKRGLGYVGFALGITLAVLLVTLWVTPDRIFDAMARWVPGLDLLTFEEALGIGGVAGLVAAVMLLRVGGALEVRDRVFNRAAVRAGASVVTLVILLLISHLAGVIYRSTDYMPNDSLARAAEAIEEVAPESPVAKRLRASLQSPAAWREAQEWLRAFKRVEGKEVGLEALERVAMLGEANSPPEVRAILAQVRRDGMITRADRVAIVTAAAAPGSGLDPYAVANAMR